MLGMAEESHGESHHDLSSHSGTHGNESITGNCDSMGFGNMESMSIDDGECLLSEEMRLTFLDTLLFTLPLLALIDYHSLLDYSRSVDDVFYI